MSFSKADAERVFRTAGLQAGDTVLVQSGFRNFRAIEGGPHALIEALLAVLGSSGTLIMPAFNMTAFGNNKFYSKRNTKPETGLLCELFAQWEGCRRIYHPIHGFSLVGKNAGPFSEKISNQSSFEESSLWGELYRMDAKLMLLGVSYREGFSFFHYLEETLGVPYRKFIELSGKVEELDGHVHEITVPYYGRVSMEIGYDFDKLIPYLEGEGASLVKTGVLGSGVVRLMNARPVYDALAAALRKHPNLVLTNH